MAKKQDRRYHYPKGYIDKRTRRAKTGFMPPDKGAKIFVKGNFDEIKKGNIPFTSLTDREKKIFKGLVSDRNQNTFYFEGKRYYDPTGSVRFRLNQVPRLKDQKKLDNLLTKQMFDTFFNTNYQPMKAKENLNVSLFQFKAGDKKNLHYRSNKGNMLDVIKNLKNYERAGYEIDVDGFKGKSGIIQLKDFEQEAIRKALEGKEFGDGVKFEILYDLKINPKTKKIYIDTDKTKIFEFYQQKAKKK